MFGVNEFRLNGVAEKIHCFLELKDPEARAFILSQCFEEFWKLLPCLIKLHDNGVKISIGKRMLPTRTYCRELFRKRFNHRIELLARRSRTVQPPGLQVIQLNDICLRTPFS